MNVLVYFVVAAFAFRLFYVYEYLTYMNVYAPYVCLEEVPEPLELELGTIVWVLGIKPWFSGSAASAPDCWAAALLFLIPRTPISTLLTLAFILTHTFVPMVTALLMLVTILDI